MKISIIYRIFIIVVIFVLSGCGANNPNTTTNTSLTQSQQTQPSLSSPTISAYTTPVHKNAITNYAIELLKDKGNLTPRQLAILKNPYYIEAIMKGIEEESGKPGGGTEDVERLHFWDPEHYKQLTDAAKYEIIDNSLLNAKTWAQAGGRVWYGQQEMYAQSELRTYFKNHPTISPNDKELYNLLVRQGRVLRVLQDMSSPAYVRNDAFYNQEGQITHVVMAGIISILDLQLKRIKIIGGPIGEYLIDISAVGTSNYEEFLSLGGYTKYNTYPATATGTDIPIVAIKDDNEFWNSFDELASLTHYNFFSDDTIPYTRFDTMPPSAQFEQYKTKAWRFHNYPQIPNGVGYLSGIGKNITVSPIIGVNVVERPFTSYKEPWLDDTIQAAYADILVPKAISYTAGAIKYFLSPKSDGEIKITKPANNATIATPVVEVTATMNYFASTAVFHYRSVSSPDISRISINAEVKLIDGVYTATANIPLELGANTIDVDAYSEDVNYTSDRITVIYKKPNNVLEVVIVDPVDGQVFPDRIVSVSGMINYFSGNSAILSVNDRTQTISVANSGYFKADVILTSGSNTITVKVSDKGQIASDAVHVICTVPPSKLWVQLTWDQGASDVDLYVTEPTGETAWYAYPRNTSGGYLDVDNTWGYGPEHYMISESLGNNIAPGDYVIQVHYYASHGNPDGITGKLTVLKDEKPYGVFPFSISQPNPSSAGPGNWIVDPASWWQEVRVPLP